MIPSWLAVDRPGRLRHPRPQNAASRRGPARWGRVRSGSDGYPFMTYLDNNIVNVRPIGPRLRQFR
jgi:hypothetical protein